MILFLTILTRIAQNARIQKKALFNFKKATIFNFFCTYFKILLLLIEFAIFILKKLKNYLTSYYKNFKFTLTDRN
jgi:hypothetical protein